MNSAKLNFLHSLQSIGFSCLAQGPVDSHIQSVLKSDKVYSFYALIGNVGGEFYPYLQNKNMGAESLDDWTRHNLLAVSKNIKADVFFPFDGPPYINFQDIALVSGSYFRSPIKLLIHKKYGLWTAFRGIFLFTQKPQYLQNPKHEKASSPCISCVEKPCLNTCPVGAFQLDKPYKVEECRNYLSSPLGKNECMEKGCKARFSCPVGIQYQYKKEVARFFMKKFQKL